MINRAKMHRGIRGPAHKHESNFGSLYLEHIKVKLQSIQGDLYIRKYPFLLYKTLDST